MRNDTRELHASLTERLRIAVRKAPPVESEEHEIFPGSRYRDDRGRVVTVLAASKLAVKYAREGYREPSQVGRREFDLKFKKV